MAACRDGHGRWRGWVLVGFMAGCLAAAIGLAALFALRYGPQQVADMVQR